MSEPSTHQMRPFIKHRNPNLPHGLLRKPSATRKTNAKTRRVSPLVSASLIPRPPHLGLGIRVRPRRQKLLHHHRMPSTRSIKQRREFILRLAGSAQTDTPALCASACNPTGTRDSMYYQSSKEKEKEMERNNSLPDKTTVP